MKKTITLIALLSTFIGFSQNGPIDFEAGGQGADWTWTVFENDTNPPLKIVDNPDPSGINTSATVAEFTALQTGQPFAGVESMHGSDVGTFTIATDNAIVKVLVYKSVISDVGVKFATPAGGSTGEIKVANTLINQWEELVFDFTSVIGIPETIDVDQIIIFPDFINRSATTISYFDGITFGDQTLSVDDDVLDVISTYPNPVSDIWSIRSLEPISQVTIYNILGQEVYRDVPNKLDIDIDLSRLKPGTYITRVDTGDNTITSKILKI